VNEIEPVVHAVYRFVRGIEERLFEKIGPVRFRSHSIDPADIGVIEEQRFPTLIRPADSIS
jgi:hypothetical protein